MIAAACVVVVVIIILLLTQCSRDSKARDEVETEDYIISINDSTDTTDESEELTSDTDIDESDDGESAGSSEDLQSANAEETTASSANTTTNKSSGKTSNSSASSSSGNNTSTAHTHVWKDHTATKQVWVENWVEVADYETVTIYGAQFYTVQSDGTMLSNGPTYWIEGDFTYDDLKELSYNALKNSPNGDGVIDGVCYAQYVNRKKTEQVQTGSHMEDQGYYTTETYVDYLYCSVCGATQ